MQIHIGTSATNEELYRMTGTLPAERIDELLDNAAALESAREIVANIEDARAQYPAEDFLTDILHDAELLHKNLRGQNRLDMEALLEKLRALETETVNSAEFGIAELDKAIDALGE